MEEVFVAGAAMTRFGKHLERSARELVEEAVAAALEDAGVSAPEVGAVYVGNAVGGLMTGQESIRGQVVLRRTGLLGAPIVNVENACASSSTALHLGWQAVAAGMQDCVLVVGYEKLYDPDRQKSYRAFNASMDLEEMRTRFPGAGATRSVFMDLYASFSGPETDGPTADVEALGMVSVKNHHHGALNPLAQFREEVTLEQVLASRPIAGPLTLLMCSPLSDGAAALVLTARPRNRSRVRIAASVLTSGRGDDRSRPNAAVRAVGAAYERAGVGPEDLDVVELHDATSIAELQLYEELGLCEKGEAARLVLDRVTWLGGRLPVNPSGGLLARGHPIGATGAAQVVELAWQLQGRCGQRQVPDAKVALAQNGGGWVGTDAAACAVHVLIT
ncbi:MAG TPA: thiolase family protein [Candidatus Dormibacteraeota bacterium]|nr:thiolase family protein [Candidatus Dormibacteraeota bacterium]